MSTNTTTRNTGLCATDIAKIAADAARGVNDARKARQERLDEFWASVATMPAPAGISSDGSF